MRKRNLLALTAALLLLLSACGGEKSMSLDSNESGGVIVTAQNAKEMEALGQISVGEDQLLVISPNLEKGHFKVHITDGNKESVYDESISGKVLSTCGLEPGEYTVSVWGERGATGTLLLQPQNQEEFIAQDEELSNLLENAEKLNGSEDIDEILDAVQEMTES